MRLTSDYIYAREDSKPRTKDEEDVLKEVQKTIKVKAAPEEYVLMPKSFIAETLGYAAELDERMQNLKSETEYTLVQKEQEMQERIRSLENKRVKEQQAAAERYESIVTKLGETHRNMDDDLKRMTTSTERNMKEKDKAYELTLAQEYDKQGKLLATLQKEHDAHDKVIQELEDKYVKRFKQIQDNEDAAMGEWRAEYDKVCDLLKMDGLKFEVALVQTDEEYKNELAELRKNQEQALQAEVDRCTNALKECVSYKQNMQIMNGLIQTREGELKVVRDELADLKAKLQHSVVTFQRSIEQLQSKEESIKQRDHNIQRLKDSQKHLEGFRYVLFHKVKDLEEERGPLGSQVESLHESVREMDAEFVRAFKSKQAVETRLAELSVEVTELQGSTQLERGRRLQSEKMKHAIRDDLTEVLYEHDMKSLKNRLLEWMDKYGRFKVVGGGIDPVTLQGITDEVERQRKALKSKTLQLADNLMRVKHERATRMDAMVTHNSGIITDIETLRADRKVTEKKVSTLQERIIELQNIQKRRERERADLDPAAAMLEEQKVQAAEQAKKMRDLEKSVGSLPLIAGAEEQ